MALSQRTQCTTLGCRSTTRQPRLVARLGAGGSSTRSALSRRSGAVNVTNSLYGARYVRSRLHSTLPMLYLEYVLCHTPPHSCMQASDLLLTHANDQYKMHRSLSMHQPCLQAAKPEGCVCSPEWSVTTAAEPGLESFQTRPQASGPSHRSIAVSAWKAYHYHSSPGKCCQGCTSTVLLLCCCLWCTAGCSCFCGICMH